MAKSKDSSIKAQFFVVGDKVLWKGLKLVVTEVTDKHTVAMNQTVRVTTDKLDEFTRIE